MIAETSDKRAVEEELLSLKRVVLNGNDVVSTRKRLWDYLKTSLSDSSKVWNTVPGHSKTY